MRTTLKKLNRGSQVFTLALLLSLAGEVSADEAVQFNSGTHQLTLLELYTSQGCSSCPPAERWLGRFKEDPRLWHSVIPIAFHVDYWDYLGWHDTLAKAAFSQRQRRYQQEGKLRSVYTPAFVVNGREWRSWFGLRHLPETQQPAGKLRVKLAGGALHADYRPNDDMPHPLLLNVAILGVGIHTTVQAGENSGRVLRQDFAVLKYHRQRSDDLTWRMPLPLPPQPHDGRLALAVWVSPLNRQVPLQATGGWLP